jgi:hypothetical protein
MGDPGTFGCDQIGKAAALFYSGRLVAGTPA